jgi:molybdopterin biosynthesis enzyme MoaB
LAGGIAGILGDGLPYVLPGGARAVSEYMSEILKTLEHLILICHGIDPR